MTPFPPHRLWYVFAGLVVFTCAFGLVLEMTPIVQGHVKQTLSWILWEHWKLPAVIYFGLGFLIIGLTSWAMLHFASGGKWGI